MQSLRIILHLGAIALCASGCAATPERPVMASSVDRPAVALAYPAALELALARMERDEKEARQHMAEFPQYAGRLSSTHWELAIQIVRRADEEGRGQSYADAYQRERAVSEFLEERDRELGRKIVGSVNHATAEKGCAEEVGPASYQATKRALERQLESDTREANSAHHAIDNNEEALGKDNAKQLRDQVDAISRVSHVAHVRLDDQRRELERMAAETDEAEETLEKFAQQLTATINDPAQPAKQKNQAERRLSATRESQQMLGRQRQQLDQVVGGAVQRVKAFRDDYQAAYEALDASFVQAAEQARAAK